MVFRRRVFVASRNTVVSNQLVKSCESLQKVLYNDLNESSKALALAAFFLSETFTNIVKVEPPPIKMFGFKNRLDLNNFIGREKIAGFYSSSANGGYAIAELSTYKEIEAELNRAGNIFASGNSLMGVDGTVAGTNNVLNYSSEYDRI